MDYLWTLIFIIPATVLLVGLALISAGTLLRGVAAWLKRKGE